MWSQPKRLGSDECAPTALYDLLLALAMLNDPPYRPQTTPFFQKLPGPARLTPANLKFALSRRPCEKCGLDTETASRCLVAGAKFLTSPGLVMEVLEFALKNDLVYFPGVLTPTEVIAAWKAGADFVKIFPCAQVGGPSYIRALKVPLPQVPLIASGGVNQKTTVSFIMAGATAVGIGSDLIPPEALPRRHEAHIHELARRFLTMVKCAREERAGRT